MNVGRDELLRLLHEQNFIKSDKIFSLKQKNKNEVGKKAKKMSFKDMQRVESPKKLKEKILMQLLKQQYLEQTIDMLPDSDSDDKDDSSSCSHEQSSSTPSPRKPKRPIDKQFDKMMMAFESDDDNDTKRDKHVKEKVSLKHLI